MTETVAVDTTLKIGKLTLARTIKLSGEAAGKLGPIIIDQAIKNDKLLRKMGIAGAAIMVVVVGIKIYKDYLELKKLRDELREKERKTLEGGSNELPPPCLGIKKAEALGSNLKLRLVLYLVIS